MNVSRFGRLAGVGGFINITQTAGGVVSWAPPADGNARGDGRLHIVREARAKKLVPRVGHPSSTDPT